MLFFALCICFALFPAQVLYGAQNGLALCINIVIPSLLPFMLLSTCIINSNFSRPVGAAFSKVLTPLTGLSPCGCVCFVTGILGGYGAGARAVCESYKQKQISKNEAERLLPVCNNAGPLFIIGTVGIGFFTRKSVGVMLFLIQVLTSFICACVFSLHKKKEHISIREEWNFYKKHKPPLGELVSNSAVWCTGAISTACAFIITFSAILEALPLGEYSFLAGIIEVTRGSREMSRYGYDALPVISAFIAWGGISVHFQANALSEGMFDMKKYYVGKIFASIIAFIITKICFDDANLFALTSVCVLAVLFLLFVIKSLFSREPAQPREFRQQPHS